ncbi:hypothetical protein BS50DRAFT_628509 [Corynespora cassiicola Philippines]|uniref:Uncharacterized protein n=1 Tax=Corynespora cassiicola Philippines TaxID=1448308 RepID=A0A2T2PCA9_CORCC|nr:hypothetical protein BS50DRAFT_628509 [Corynespora cassiicola Philippines]
MSNSKYQKIQITPEEGPIVTKELREGASSVYQAAKAKQDRQDCYKLSSRPWEVAAKTSKLVVFQTNEWIKDFIRVHNRVLSYKEPSSQHIHDIRVEQSLANELGHMAYDLLSATNDMIQSEHERGYKGLDPLLDDVVKVTKTVAKAAWDLETERKITANIVEKDAVYEMVTKEIENYEGRISELRKFLQEELLAVPKTFAPRRKGGKGSKGKRT